MKRNKNPDFYSVTDLVNIGLFGHDKAYALMHSPDFPSVRIGKKLLVRREAFWLWLNSQTVAGGDGHDK